MKKILNKRPIVLFAICMLVFTFVLLYHNSFILRICLISIAGVLGVVGLLIYILHKHKTCKYIFSRIFIIALACLISVGGISMHEYLYNRDYSTYNGYAVVTGRVAEVGDFYNGNKKAIVLDNATVATSDFNKELKGKVRLVVICDQADEDIFVVGSSIVANSKISFASLYYKGEYGLSFTYAVNNITCSGYATEANISVLYKNLDLTLSDIVKNKVEDIVNGSLDAEYSGLALGMLFGDKSTLDSEISGDFSASGIAHLLAVSGLHVGFLLTILLLLCKLFKLKGVAKFIIISAILIFYAYLCGFSVSVVRATIMTICSLYAGCRYKRYDSLNALAIAVVLITLISPFSITTVGFRLSFMAVLSIILLARPIAKLLSKIFKDKLANTIATMLAVQIGTSGIIISAFNNISAISIVANFISIPIASLAYMVLFITVGISIIMPFANIVVYLFQFIMQVVVKFVHLLAQVKLFMLASWQGKAIMYTTISAMGISSNYLFINKRAKLIVAICLWISVLILLLI